MRMKSDFWPGAALAILALTASNAQNPGIQRGAQVIEQQATALQAYFQPVTTVIYVIAAIVGLIGGFRIYSKWQNGDRCGGPPRYPKGRRWLDGSHLIYPGHCCNTPSCFLLSQ